MANRKNPRLPFDSFTLQPRSVVPGGVPTSGAPINIGSNARQIAQLLQETSAQLFNAGINKTQEQEERARLAAQEEFLKAKRENTLDLLRKATIDGKIPEGLSPSYNDYRKVLIAKDTVENQYQNELNNNIGVLVDPDVPQETKSKILSDAYAKTGIDELQLDPVGNEMVLKSLSKVQDQFDALSRQKSVEVNLTKMQEAIDNDAINVLNKYNGDDEGLIDSIKTSIDIAKKAAVKEPTNKVINTYLKQLDTLSKADSDRALMALDALEDASTDDGSPLTGNVEIASKLVAMRERIEDNIYRESLDAEKSLRAQRDKIIRSIESELTASDLNDPEAIDAKFESFITEQQKLSPDQQLPIRIISDISKEREALVDQARRIQNNDAADIYRKQQQLQLLGKNYSNQVAAAVSDEEVDTIIDDINSRDDLTIKDKTALINQVNMSKSAFEFSKANYDPNDIGIDNETARQLASVYSTSVDDIDETIKHVQEFGATKYHEFFMGALDSIAKSNNMTVEQALAMNKSYYVNEDKVNLPDNLIDPSRREGQVLDKSSNLVKLASDKAHAEVIKYVKETLENNKKLWGIKEELTEEAIMSGLTPANSAGLRFYKNSMNEDANVTSGAIGQARNAIVVTRADLARKAENILKYESDVSTFEQEKKKTSYYRMQNALGYSIKEIINGKTLANLPIEFERIDPTTTQVVWNNRELEFLEGLPENEGNAIANKLGLNSIVELIAFQKELMNK